MLTTQSDLVKSVRSNGVFAIAAVSGAWLRRVAIALAVGYLVIAIALVARRAVGAFQQPLSAETLTAVGVALIVIGEVLRAALANGHSADHAILSWWPMAPAVGALLIAAAISVSGSSPIGLLLMWTLTSTHAAWALSCEFVANRRSVQTRSPILTSAADLSATAGRPSAPPGLASDVVQQLLRRREPDGSEWLNGSLRVDFCIGQRVASAHVAFCPPFLATPDCEAESVDGPDCQVKISQLLPHGARFEVRLDRPTQSPASVLLDFAAHAESFLESSI